MLSRNLQQARTLLPTSISPRVTRFLSPPLTPRIISLPRGVSAQLVRPSTRMMSSAMMPAPSIDCIIESITSCTLCPNQLEAIPLQGSGDDSPSTMNTGVWRDARPVLCCVQQALHSEGHAALLVFSGTSLSAAGRYLEMICPLPASLGCSGRPGCWQPRYICHDSSLHVAACAKCPAQLLDMKLQQCIVPSRMPLLPLITFGLAAC